MLDLDMPLPEAAMRRAVRSVKHSKALISVSRVCAMACRISDENYWKRRTQVRATGCSDLTHHSHRRSIPMLKWRSRAAS